MMFEWVYQAGLILNQKYLYFVCSILSISSLLLNIKKFTVTKKPSQTSLKDTGGRFSMNDTVIFMTSHLP